MKIAISSTGMDLDAQIDPRFGRCAHLIIVETDERQFPAKDELSENAGVQSLNEFWASAVRAVKGSVSEKHGLSVRSIVFVKPRSLEKTSSGKLRRNYYQKLLLKGELAVLHENRSPMIS